LENFPESKNFSVTEEKPETGGNASLPQENGRPWIYTNDRVLARAEGDITLKR